MTSVTEVHAYVHILKELTEKKGKKSSPLATKNRRRLQTMSRRQRETSVANCRLLSGESKS
jgi:hypothetical protein